MNALKEFFGMPLSSIPQAHLGGAFVFEVIGKGI